MVTYRGYQTSVMYGAETAYGTGGTANTAIKGKISQFTHNPNNNLIRTLGMGEGRNETFVGFGNFEGTWSMEYEVASFEFLKFGIGALAGSGTAASPYYLEEKEFMDYSTGMTSFALEVGSNDASGTDNVDTLTGCILDKIGLSLEIGATLKGTLEGFYRTVTTTTSAGSYTPDTTKPWTYAQGAFKWNGSSVGRVQSATINISNNFDPDTGRELGSRFVEAAEPGLRKYDWVIVVKMTSSDGITLFNAFYGSSGTPDSGIADAEPTFYDIILNLSEGSSSGDRNAQILMENAAINDISKPINLTDNIVELTINGSAKAGKTDTVKKPFKWWTV